jgi:aspartate/methionine/tyrosine aminotransferase
MLGSGIPCHPPSHFRAACMLNARDRTDAIAPFHVVEILDRARQLEAAGHDIVHMEVGEPDFRTPPQIIDAAAAALRDRPLGYTPALGIPELREAIADFYWQRHGVRIPPRRVAVTAGASGALTLACACLVAPGSRWLLTDPGYPCNRSFIRAFEGQPSALPTGPAQSFQPTAAQLATAWDERTGGALLASPSNPTGTLIGDDALATIAALIQERGASLIVDEIYSGLCYDEPPRTALSLPPSLADDLWIVQSFSKYWQMTGWRLGWLVVPERHLRAVEKLAQNLFIAPATTAQYAALAAFRSDTLALVDERRSILRERRDRLLPLLSELGFRVPVKPRGAFYVYADSSGLTGDSYRFALDLLDQAQVAITPGVDFGQTGARDHVRFAYTTDTARIEMAAERIASYLKKRSAP